MQRSTNLAATQDSLINKAPSLLNLHLPIWSGLPFSLVSPTLHVCGVGFRLRPGKSQGPFKLTKVFFM